MRNFGGAEMIIPLGSVWVRMAWRIAESVVKEITAPVPAKLL